MRYALKLLIILSLFSSLSWDAVSSTEEAKASAESGNARKGKRFPSFRVFSSLSKPFTRQPPARPIDSQEIPSQYSQSVRINNDVPLRETYNPDIVFPGKEERLQAVKLLKNTHFQLSPDNEQKLLALFCLVDISLEQKKQIMDAVLYLQAALWQASDRQAAYRSEPDYAATRYNEIIKTAYTHVTRLEQNLSYYKKNPDHYVAELLASFNQDR